MSIITHVAAAPSLYRPVIIDHGRQKSRLKQLGRAEQLALVQYEQLAPRPLGSYNGVPESRSLLSNTLKITLSDQYKI